MQPYSTDHYGVIHSLRRKITNSSSCRIARQIERGICSVVMDNKSGYFLVIGVALQTHNHSTRKLNTSFSFAAFRCCNARDFKPPGRAIDRIDKLPQPPYVTDSPNREESNSTAMSRPRFHPYLHRPFRSERIPFLRPIVALPDVSEAMFEDSLQSPPEENTEDRHIESVEELVREWAPGFPTPFQPPVRAMVPSTHQAGSRHQPDRVLVDENPEDLLAFFGCSSLLYQL